MGGLILALWALIEICAMIASAVIAFSSFIHYLFFNSLSGKSESRVAMKNICVKTNVSCDMIFMS